MTMFHSTPRQVSPLTYAAFIGMFPYNQNGFSTLLRNRVICCNIFYFIMSIACRIGRIIIAKPEWSISILQFFRVFVYVSVQVVQLVFFGFHLSAVFKHKEVLEKFTRTSTIVPTFFKAVTYIDVIYTVSLCIMLVFRCLALKSYFGIWNAITIAIQNHFSFQVTMLFTFFVYNITKRHERLTKKLASGQPSKVSI